MQTKGIHAFVSGQVQGVWYRASTEREANRLGVKGWVKNLPDGRVETMAVGDVEKIDAYVNWLWKGSAGAKVSDVDVSKLEPIPSFDDFQVVS